MASLSFKARKLFKTETEAYMSSNKVKHPRLGVQRFFEKSKLSRGFSSNFDIHRELEEIESSQQSDEVDIANNNELSNFDRNGGDVAKPPLRRRHSFSTIESMARTFIEKVRSRD